MGSSNSERGAAQFGAATKPVRADFVLGKRVRLSDAYVKAALLPSDVPSFGVVSGFPIPRRITVRWDDGTESNVLATNLESADAYGMDHMPQREPVLPPAPQPPAPQTPDEWRAKAREFLLLARRCRIVGEVVAERNRELAADAGRLEKSRGI